MSAHRTVFASISIAFAFSLLVVPSSFGAADTRQRKMPTVSTTASLNKTYRGNMTRMTLSIDASGKTAAAAGRLVSKTTWHTEKAIQAYLNKIGDSKAKVIKSAINTGGRYRYRNNSWYWNRDNSRAAQKITIEFSGTNGTRAAKISDFAFKMADKFAGDNAPIDVSMSPARHQMTPKYETKVMSAVAKLLRIKGTKEMKGALLNSEKLGPLTERQMHRYTWSPWSEGGIQVNASMKLKAEVFKR